MAKKRFIETRFYSIFFMVIITAFFISILSAFYLLTEKKVKTFQENAEKKLVLNSFDLPADDVQNFDKFIKVQKKQNRNYYIAERSGKLIGYCFPITGKGLWGSINALIAVTPDFQKIINLEIVDQNETPGLGGRITEDWFKDQFRKKVLLENGKIVNFQLVSEDEKTNKDQINQITGATLSSRSVLNMIQDEYSEILKDLK